MGFSDSRELREFWGLSPNRPPNRPQTGPTDEKALADEMPRAARIPAVRKIQMSRTGRADFVACLPLLQMDVNAVVQGFARLATLPRSRCLSFGY